METTVSAFETKSFDFYSDFYHFKNELNNRNNSILILILLLRET